MTVQLLTGDCRVIMADMDPESVDAIVCDPPYELGFMGKGWDKAGVAFDPATWATCLRVVKPGGHLLAFGGTRTFHRMTVAIEDAGFEIRDCLSFMYGSGFPKSHNLDGEWQGWGTALKPAWEPIIMARRPLAGTVAANVTTHGTGALNIDGCRIGTDDDTRRHNNSGTGNVEYWRTGKRESVTGGHESGRWPANVCLDESAAEMLDQMSGERGVSRGASRGRSPMFGIGAQDIPLGYGDTGGASRFFYTAKASRSERNKGLDGMPERLVHPDEPNGRAWDIPGSHSTARANHHPTVKPLSLMQWLVRLVAPPGGVVLDPFMGSGSTGIAADREGFSFIGIEQNPEYVEIARRRIVGDAPLFADLETA